MNYYLVTIRDRNDAVIEEFVQGAANLRLALDVSTSRLTGLAAGHGASAARATVELMKTCRCGQFDVAEYGPECPSCKQAVAS